MHVSASASERVIPACAGSRDGLENLGVLNGGHPRVRGEQFLVFPFFLDMLGSSPRARGAADGCPRRVRRLGVIPACAGSSRGRSPLDRSARGHPRVRGEQSRRDRLGHQVTGSSPRARGAAPSSPLKKPLTRVIPACAGSRTSSSPRPTDPWGHPRVRGEQHRPGRPPRRVTGSSPRARGAVPDLQRYPDRPAVFASCRETDKTDTPQSPTPRHSPSSLERLESARGGVYEVAPSVTACGPVDSRPDPLRKGPARALVLQTTPPGQDR